MCLDHVAHGKRLESHRKCIATLEYGRVAISLSDVFPEERRKVGCADDGGTGSFVGHERCGGRSLRRNGRRRVLVEVIQRCFRELWQKQGLTVRVLVSREATVSIRMSQETEEPRHGTVEGFEEKQKQRKEQEREFKCCHECGKFGLGVRSGEASVFEASKRSVAETR